MCQMPRIWLDYCQFLMDQCKVTRTRRTFDRALQALPLTQHHRIWPLYIKFVRKHNIVETTLRVYRRYLKVSWQIFDNFRNTHHSSHYLSVSIVCICLCLFCSDLSWEHWRIHWVLEIYRSSGWSSREACWHCQRCEDIIALLYM